MIFRIVLIGMGIFFLLDILYHLAKKKMVEVLEHFWGVLSVVFILVGVIPFFWNQDSSAYGKTEYVILIMFFVVICIMFKICKELSGTIMRNRELAMQVSLLNNENEQILRNMEILLKEQKLKANGEE